MKDAAIGALGVLIAGGGWIITNLKAINEMLQVGLAFMGFIGSTLTVWLLWIKIRNALDARKHARFHKPDDD